MMPDVCSANGFLVELMDWTDGPGHGRVLQPRAVQKYGSARA